MWLESNQEHQWTTPWLKFNKSLGDFPIPSGGDQVILAVGGYIFIIFISSSKNTQVGGGGGGDISI